MGRVLVIEDDMSVRRVLEMTLELAGHEVEVAPTLSAGRRALQAGRQDLVILDMTLPDGNGMEILHFIRKSLGRDTPVIVLSGLQQEVNVVRGLELGANDYITKPFSPRELLARVAKWTSSSRIGA